MIYLICSIYTLSYAFSRLYRSGMSPKVRSLFLQKQLYYVLTYILVWLCFLGHAIVSIIVLYKEGTSQTVS